MTVAFIGPAEEVLCAAFLAFYPVCFIGTHSCTLGSNAAFLEAEIVEKIICDKKKDELRNLLKKILKNVGKYNLGYVKIKGYFFGNTG